MTETRLRSMLASRDGIVMVTSVLQSLYYNPTKPGGLFSRAFDEYTESLRSLVGIVRANRYTGNLPQKSVKAVSLLLGDKGSNPENWALAAEQLDCERQLIEATEKLDLLCRQLQGEVIPEED